MTKGMKWLVGIVVVLVITAATITGLLVSKTIRVGQARLDAVDVTPTYADDLAAKAYADKHAKAPSAADIAKKALLTSVGIGTNQTSYQLTGIGEDDGLFVTAGILTGNGVPYSSTLTSDAGSTSLSDFDIQDKNYWNKVKEGDFNKMKDAQQKVVQQLNTTSANENAFADIVRKAQDDAKNKDTNSGADVSNTGAASSSSSSSASSTSSSSSSSTSSDNTMNSSSSSSSDSDDSDD